MVSQFGVAGKSLCSLITRIVFSLYLMSVVRELLIKFLNFSFIIYAFLANVFYSMGFIL